MDRQTTRINAARTELGPAERLAAEARSLREGRRRRRPGLAPGRPRARRGRRARDRGTGICGTSPPPGEAIDQFFKDHPWLEWVLQIAVGILTIAFPCSG